MNFFGHALVAQRNEATRGAVRAEFVLGSMLPDFASMLRTRQPNTTHAAIEAGLRFHHVTDEAFHGSRAFLEFSGQASTFLRSHGLARGSARAVAHVGVELLLDAALADERANEAYLSAVQSALTLGVSDHIQWVDQHARKRFAQLCHNLESRGPVRTDASPELMAQRLRNILADRPRLALDDEGQSVVRVWAMTMRPSILAGAAALLAEVELRLQLANHLER